MRINKHDTNGTKPLLGKGELGYDDYVAGGDVGRVYVGTGSENIALAERLESNMMTKAQFNALAEERKANRAGSGFDEYGKHRSGHPNINEGMWVSSTLTANAMFMGRISTDGGIGLSRSDNPIININGTILKIINVANSSTFNTITLPTAPNIYPYDTVLTAEQIASGVIKHADASNSGLIVNGKFDTYTSGWTSTGTLVHTNNAAQVNILSRYQSLNQASIGLVNGKNYILTFEIISNNVALYVGFGNSAAFPRVLNPTFLSAGKYTFTFTADSSNNGSNVINFISDSNTGQFVIDNIAVYPADAISRSDLVFLESWHEDISEKNCVYPLGNVQYLGGNTDGLTGITNGNFTGFETYSLFGNWQTPSALIGKGYIWSNLTEAQKRAFIANPENNCYLDGDKTIQVRYRVRVVHGITDTGFNTYPYNSYFNNPSSGYVKPKGKQVVISSDWGAADSSGIYGHGTANWTANLPYANELGIFSATSSNGSTSGFLNGSYNGQCFALPIALVHR